MEVRIAAEAVIHRMTRIGGIVIVVLKPQNRSMPISLLVIFVVQVALQFSINETASAFYSCFFLIFFMYIAAAYGGWTSLRGMWYWLRQHPRSAAHMTLCTLLLSFALFVPEIGSIAARVSLVIQGAFFYYAGTSVIVTLVDKIRTHLRGE